MELACVFVARVDACNLCELFFRFTAIGGREGIRGHAHRIPQGHKIHWMERHARRMHEWPCGMAYKGTLDDEARLGKGSLCMHKARPRGDAGTASDSAGNARTSESSSRLLFMSTDATATDLSPGVDGSSRLVSSLRSAKEIHVSNLHFAPS